jgi:TPR repeat protein
MGGLKRSCRQAVLRYKKVCEVGPWVDSTHGPREAVREFRRGREGSALTLSLLAALEGYEVAQFNAAWMLMRGKGMEESNVIFSTSRKKNTKMRYETAASVLLQLTQQSPANAESNLLLGDIFMGGYQVSLNLNSSAVYYERASEGGSVLGTMMPCITLCCITSCCALLCYAVLCCALLSCVVLICTAPDCMIPCCCVLCRAAVYYTVLLCIIPCCCVLYRAAVYSAVIE